MESETYFKCHSDYQHSVLVARHRAPKFLLENCVNVGPVLQMFGIGGSLHANCYITTEHLLGMFSIAVIKIISTSLQFLMEIQDHLRFCAFHIRF